VLNRTAFNKDPSSPAPESENLPEEAARSDTLQELFGGNGQQSRDGQRFQVLPSKNRENFPPTFSKKSFFWHYRDKDSIFRDENSLDFLKTKKKRGGRKGADLCSSSPPTPKVLAFAPPTVAQDHMRVLNSISSLILGSFEMAKIFSHGAR
jgi:hypothetical protein